jgi:hypothetical protein
MRKYGIQTLFTDIQKKTGARNRISIDFDATETTKEIPKGQLISKCPFGTIVLTKIPTNFF